MCATLTLVDEVPRISSRSAASGVNGPPAGPDWAVPSEVDGMASDALTRDLTCEGGAGQVNL